MITEHKRLLAAIQTAQAEAGAIARKLGKSLNSIVTPLGLAARETQTRLAHYEDTEKSKPVPKAKPAPVKAAVPENAPKA